MPLSLSFTNSRCFDAGHSSIKQERPAVLCQPRGRGWIWFTHQGVFSTQAGQGPGPGDVTKSYPVNILYYTVYKWLLWHCILFQVQESPGAENQNPDFRTPNLCSRPSFRYCKVVQIQYLVSTWDEDEKVSISFHSFRDKLGFRQRAGSLAGFGSKKHHINWVFGYKNQNTHLWLFLLRKHHTDRDLNIKI